MTNPISFVRDGRRYTAHVASRPGVQRNDEPSPAWWFVSVNDGPELRVMEAEPDDTPGEELYERLAAAAAKAEACE